MKYFLDTNICIYFLNGKYPNLLKKFAAKLPEQIKIPSIVAAELFYGAEKSKSKKATTQIVHDFLLPFEIVEFGKSAIEVYGKIRFELEKSGFSIGPNDLLIASIAIANNAKLVTNNIKEFKRIKTLKIENWV